MLQIVIWMLCVYFVVKGFEIISDPAQRNTYGSIGAIIAFIAAPAFFWMSIEQTKQQPEFPTALGMQGSLTDPTMDVEEADAAADNALAAAERAIAEADSALRNAQ